MTRYALDDYGQVTRVQELGYTDGEGTSDLDTSDGLTTLISYARRTTSDHYIVDRPSLARKLPGLSTSDDASRRLWGQRYYYDGAAAGALQGPGNLTEVERWTENGYERLARYAYYASGNLEHSYGPRGYETDYAYAGPDHLFLASVRNPLGHEVTTAWSNGCQAPARITDANGLETDIDYDAHCREARRTLPTGHVTETNYVDLGDAGAQYVEVRQASASSRDNRDVHRAREHFDGLGQVWKTLRTGLSEDAADYVSVLTAHDARGNVAWRSIPLSQGDPGDGGGLGASQKTQFTYDGRDRLLRTTHANGVREEVAYGTVAITAQDGSPGVRHRQTVIRGATCFDNYGDDRTHCQTTRTLVGGRGWVVRSTVEDPGGTAVGTDDTQHSTSYRHDALGRLVGLVDPRGSAWSYSYDRRGHRTRMNDPDLGVWTMSYDAAGNLTRRTDAKGQVVT